MEKIVYLFSDEYTGPRWTYGLTYRPLDIAAVPKGFIIGSLKPNYRFRHGTVDYPAALTQAQMESYELTYVPGDHTIVDSAKEDAT